MVTGTRSKCGRCSWLSAFAVVALFAWALAPAAFAQSCGEVAPNLSILDCNGDGVDDGAVIPAECDFEMCRYLWDGFPKSAGGFPDSFWENQLMDGLDYYADGHAWSNPSDSAKITTYGCEGGLADPNNYTLIVEPNASNLQADRHVDSEYFRTVNGELDCGGAVHRLSFLPMIAGIQSTWDWEFVIYDARVRDALASPGENDGVVIRIMFTSTDTDKGAPGYIMVQNPDTGPTYISTGFQLAQYVCYEVEVVLDNRDGTVQLYVGGAPAFDPPLSPLDDDAHRMDYFRVNTSWISSGAGTTTGFRADGFRYCVTGPALEWPDCNGNCVDDAVDLSSGLDTDCDGNGTLDACDEVSHCGCDSTGEGDECLACSHDHNWTFESAEGFVTGSLQCQENWQISPDNKVNSVLIVDSQAPFSGQPGFSGRALKVGPKSSTKKSAARGPRTQDEQPDNPDATGDADMEYWEFNAVVSNIAAGNVLFVVWDECTGTFVHDDSTLEPTCASGTEPTCAMIERGEDNYNTYARFNAGVRFRHSSYPDHPGLLSFLYRSGTTMVWGNSVHQVRADWQENVGKHVLIAIDNANNTMEYYLDEYVSGQIPWQRWILGGTPQQSVSGGDRRVAMVNTDLVTVAYFDNLSYETGSNCDGDSYDDSVYLPGGVYGSASYDVNGNGALDWCEDCNENCVLDTQDISVGTSMDCNLNGIPDECDIDSALPLFDQYGCIPAGGATPSGGWNRYTQQGGGSFDSNSNGIPDECEVAEDCNGNGILDDCEIDCDHANCIIDPEDDQGLLLCGLGFDCQGNGTLDECEDDCNGNLIGDDCDISGGTSTDLNGSGIPDDCEVDCDLNGTPDDMEIAADASLDCDVAG